MFFPPLISLPNKKKKIRPSETIKTQFRRIVSIFCLAGVAFAHGSTTFAQKALSLQILLANLNQIFKILLKINKKIKISIRNYRTVETLAVVIVIHSLYPAITGFDRVATSVTLGGEQFIPIYFDLKFSFKFLIQFFQNKN